MSEVVSILREDGIRLNFEDMELMPKDAITVSKALQEWGKRDPSSLSERQAHLLERAKTLKAEGSADSVVLDYNTPTLTGDQLFKGAVNASQILEKTTKVIPGFAMSNSNGSWVLFWKEANYPKALELTIKRVTPAEAYQTLNDKILKAAKLNLISFAPLPYADDPARKVTLDIQGVDLYVALTRFAEALGPDVVWSISGPSSNRMITFSRLSEVRP